MEDKNKTTKITELEGEEALFHRLNVHYSNDEELTKKGESSASSSRILEEEMDDFDFEYYDSDCSESEEEYTSKKVNEYFRLGQEILDLDKKLELSHKIHEVELEKYKKMEWGSEEQKKLKKELYEKAEVHDKRIDERKKKAERFFELKKEIARDKKSSASTSKGKEVIKAEISQELAAARETFANFTVSPTT